MTLARVWTGYNNAPTRPNIAIVKERKGRGNWIDSMILSVQDKDRLPKTQLKKGYLGDGYPLCSELPAQPFLLRGTEYRVVEDSAAEGPAGYSAKNAGANCGGRSPFRFLTSDGDYSTNNGLHKRGTLSA